MVISFLDVRVCAATKKESSHMPVALISNPDHKCRNDDCKQPMPLPAMWGKKCPACGKMQPTQEALFAREPETPIPTDVVGVAV